MDFERRQTSAFSTVKTFAVWNDASILETSKYFAVLQATMTPSRDKGGPRMLRNQKVRLFKKKLTIIFPIWGTPMGKSTTSEDFVRTTLGTPQIV